WSSGRRGPGWPTGIASLNPSYGPAEPEVPAGAAEAATRPRNTKALVGAAEAATRPRNTVALWERLQPQAFALPLATPSSPPDQPPLHRQQPQLVVGREPELGVDVGPVRIRRLGVDADGRRHPGHRMPARQQQEDLRLALGELGQLAEAVRAVPVVVAHVGAQVGVAAAHR